MYLERVQQAIDRMLDEHYEGSRLQLETRLKTTIAKNQVLWEEIYKLNDKIAIWENKISRIPSWLRWFLKIGDGQ